MRDHHMLDGPEFIAWQYGKRLEPAGRASWRHGWHDAVAAAVGRGVVVRRARIVSEPVHDCIRYEHDLTHGNLAAGEQVRWLSRRNTKDLCLPGLDFWVFDDQVVHYRHFTGDGQLAEMGEEILRDPAPAKHCAQAFELVWECFILHERYSA
ncbi:DUF6879 family protein [Streptomyces sp. LS1784]|uniref:DUF6879 family protein n=1 Tax=Streptomyces sp. LS1784 TaxID=2851533 RepID=UPI001CCC8FCD|nr:DUF6879 family protein [Streptomyces sp. LS1784]